MSVRSRYLLHAASVIALFAFTGCRRSDARSPQWVAARDRANACDFAGALESFDAPGLPERQTRAGRLMRARILIQLERGRDAIEELRDLPPSGRFEAPDSAELARLLAYGIEPDIAAAERSAEAAFREAPAVLVQGALGAAYLGAGRHADAEKFLLAALELEPTLSGALYNLGCLRAAQGRLAEAVALIRQARVAGIRDPARLRADPALESVRRSGLIDDLLAEELGECDTW